MKKPVINLNTGEVFESISAAANGNETLRKHILEVCKGKRFTANGCRWGFLTNEEYTQYSITLCSHSEMESMINNHRKAAYKEAVHNAHTEKVIMEQRVVKAEKYGRKIMCVELGIVFPSINEACRYLGRPRKNGNLYHVLNGKRETAFGYHWKYVD